MSPIPIALLRDWDFERNQKHPEGLIATSHYLAHWICPQGHRYQMRVEWRNRGCGCYYCSGKRPIKGETDLGTLRQDLVAEWDFGQNQTAPDEITLFSKYRAWWICKLGHSWQMRVDARTSQHQGCPFCSGHRVLVGETDLATTHPELASQWMMQNSKSPSDVSAGSGYKAWWQCPEDQDHQWRATVLDRKNEQGCPRCAKVGYSIVERSLADGLSSIGGLQLVPCNSLDIRWPVSKRRLLPDIEGLFHGMSFVVEYDGWYFHKDREAQDSLKTRLLLDAGYVVVRVREATSKGSLAPLAMEHARLFQVEHSWDKRGTNLGTLVATCESILKLTDKGVDI